MVHSRDNVGEQHLFDSTLVELASAANYDNVKAMVASHANARNGLLYASDSDVPRSQLTHAGLAHRKSRAIAMLVLTIMIYQSRSQLSMVRQATFAFLGVIAKLPTATA
jgi:hypothetical protein